MNTLPSHPSSRIDRPALAWGAFLIGLGLLVAVLQLDLVEVSQIVHLWPLLPIAFGVTRMLAADDARGRRIGLGFALVGAWLLVNTLELFGLDWGTSWPVMVIGGGLFSLVAPTPTEDRFDGFVWAVAGVWMLCITQGWLGLEWGNSWPLLLVFVGLGIFGRALVQAVRAFAAGRN